MTAPTPDTVSKRGNYRTLLLWLVLVAMFIALYQLFKVKAPDGAGREPVAASDLLSTVPAVVVAAALVGWFAATMRRNRRFNAETKEAIEQFNKGNPRDGGALLERIAARTYFSSSLRAIARHNLGWARMRQSRHDEAIALLSAVERPDWKKQKGGLGECNAWRLAQACALRGEVGAAEAWLTEAESRKATPPPEALLIVPLLRCRQGRAGEAAGHIDDHAREADSRLTGDNLRVLGLVRAFAESQRGPRDGGRVDELLERGRPLHPGDFDYLGANWPELELFMQTHGISRPARAAS